MKKITFPLKLQMQGPDVKNLQDALQQLLDRGIIQVDDKHVSQKSLLAAIQKEQDEQLFGSKTAKMVSMFQRERQFKINSKVDKTTADALNLVLTELDLLDEEEEYTVSGQVTLPDGTGIAGLLVRAFDKCLGKEKQLAKSTTKKDGTYLLTYKVDHLINPARKQPDLFVRVIHQTGSKKETDSPLIINALTHEVINFVIGNEPYRGPDLYSQLHQRLADYLNDTALDEIELKELYCVANKSAMNIEWIQHYVLARQWEEQWGILPAAIFFAWFREGLPTDYVGLLSRNLEELQTGLEQAVEENLVSSAMLAYSKKLESKLNKWRSNYVITSNNSSVSQASLGQLLAISKLSKDQRQQLLLQWQTFEGEASEFWAIQHEQLGEAISQDLDLTLQLGALTRNHLPLIKVLKDQKNIRQFADIAKFSNNDWLRLFKESELEMPDDLQGEGLLKKQHAYAGALIRFTELLQPTRALVEALTRDTEIDSQQLDRFFNLNPDFEFQSYSIKSYLAENPEALANVSDPKETQLQLEAMQRVFHLSPAINRYSVAKILWKNQLHSAWAIILRGEEALIDMFGDGKRELAIEVYNKSTNIQQSSQAIRLQHMDFQFVFGYVFPHGKIHKDGIPDFESLFGGQGYCQCKHCVSFFSPSAYLVDLFLYLQKAKQNSGDTALEKLFERRPDLSNIELDCENALTVLPYIDLVNEVLENAIKSRIYNNTKIKIGKKTVNLPFAKASDPVPQTEEDTATLKAFPQHLNPAVYQTLQYGDQSQGLSFPWNLPFNLWAAEVRTYLQHLGIPRWKIMESLLGQQNNQIDIAIEYLDLIPEEKNILVNINTDEETLDQYWGVTSALVTLTKVEDILKQSGFNYQELLQLLNLRYIQRANPDQTLRIRFVPTSSCLVADAQLENLNEIALNRIHRLGRLHRKINEPLMILDQTVMALGEEINDIFLQDYAYLQRIEQILPRKIRRLEILRWWSLLDTFDYPQHDSLYRSLFLNPGIGVAETEFEIDEDKNELTKVINNQATTLVLENRALDPDIQASLLAAFQWTMTELTTLVSDEWETAAFELNLANLSYLYRVSSFCRSLRIKVAEYLTLKAVLGFSPLPGPNEIGTVRPQDSHSFIQQYQRIKDVGLSSDILNYILRHQYRDEFPFALDIKELEQILFDLQVQLNSLLNAADPEGIPVAEKVQIKLSRILLPEDIVITLQILKNDPDLELSELERNEFVDKKLRFFHDPVAAKSMLIDGGLSDLNERYNFVLKDLTPYIVDNAAVQLLAESVGISTELVNAMLNEYLPHPVDSTLPAIRIFFSLDFLNPVEDTRFNITSFPNQANIVLLLQKIGVVINHLNLDTDTLNFVMKQGAGIGLPDFSEIPLTQISTPLSVNVFASWRLLMELVRINQLYFQGSSSVFDVLSYPYDSDNAHHSLSGLLDLLSVTTRWDRNDLTYLTGSSKLNLSYPQDFRRGDWLVKIAGTMPLVARIGVSALQMSDWTSVEITQAQAISVRHVVKAKYGNEQWLEVIAPLRNKIREQQRDALLSFVLHHIKKHDQSSFIDEDDLYGYYLIDPQMGACALTSRTVLASSSVQLLVQRIQMNLEKDAITFSGKHAKEWKWRKNYRVWEANRKVFLWPENWIEPELRDDKSPFFQELENELLQDELNEETVERVFTNYLYKLDEVARLEICGVHYDDKTRTLHIFSRTPGTPSLYYYRRWENQRDWTAWEKVELDIYNTEGVERPQTGISLLPVVHNRSLYLFWPIFTLKQDEPSENEKKEIAKLEDEIEEIKETSFTKDIVDSLKNQKSAIESGINTLKEHIIDMENFSSNFPNVDIDKGVESLESQIKTLESKLLEINAKINKLEKDGNIIDANNIQTKKNRINEINQGHAYYTIKMAYSQYRQGYWTAKKLTNQAAPLFYFQHPFNKGAEINRYFLVPSKTGQGRELRINLYFNSNKRTYYNLYVFFIFVSCRNELIIKSKSFSIEKMDKSLPDPMNYMKARDDATRKNVPLHVTNSANEKDLLLNTAAKGNLLSFSLNQGIFQQTTPFFYEDQQRTFLIIPPQLFFPFKLLFPQKKKYSMGLAGLNDYILAGKSKPLTQMAYGNFLKPNLESQDVVDKIQLIKNEDVLDKFFQSNESDHIFIRSAKKTSVTESQNPSLLSQSIMQLQTANTMGENLDSPVRMTSTKLKNIFNGYIFQTFYHPHVCLFLKQLNRYGIEGLLNPSPDTKDGTALDQQATPNHDQEFNFSQVYDPNWNEVSSYELPQEIINFDYKDAYASYNWELFFHIPLLIATRCYQDQRFEAAQRWFHYIFNPTETEGEFPYRFWKIKPFHFYNQEQMIADMELILQGKSTSQIQTWQANPFNPHLLARFRRVAYMKTTVMKYLDNLIAWGDQLFRRDSIESLNEATQLYVLAGQILGKLPIATEAKQTEVKTFSELAEQLDDLGNALVELQINQQELVADNISNDRSSSGNPDLIPYFCFPPNEKLLAYWDTVSDRLFKIRNCMNLEGMVRHLPLFQPPIDPALLVRAVASGMDLNSALNDLYAPMPLYRFSVMIQKAQEICHELKSLGGSLLSALEKKDAEELALIGAQQQTELFKANKDIRIKQVEEAQLNLKSLEEAKEIANIRYKNYQDRDSISTGEGTAIGLSISATVAQFISGVISASAVPAKLIPDFVFVSHTQGLASGASAEITTVGGEKTGDSLESVSKGFEIAALILREAANTTSTFAQYSRRQEDWDLQSEVAQQEMKQIDKQILASEIRIAISIKEQENLELQISQSQTVADFMKKKYTDQQLYGWMKGQLASVYFQTYQLAYDIAKQAEKTFIQELGIEKSNYIKFGYWDNLRKGLLSGEKLSLDLKRLEIAYLEKNRREYELTKHISIRQLNPIDLLTLKATGSCEVIIPEWVFDLDNPGHYMRRIKNVNLSIPAVTGPYKGVNCTLSLIKSTLRRSSLLKENKYSRTPPEKEDARFVDYYGTGQSIVTSNAQNDSGLFETNLRDERFLPFEGHGVVSTWKLELPKNFRQFDYNTISDVILHFRYTARQGGDILRQNAVEHLNILIKEIETSELIQLFSLRHDFPTEWHRFVTDTDTNKNFIATIKKTYFPYFVQSGEIEISTVKLFSIDNLKLLSSVNNGLEIVVPSTALQTNNEFEISLEEDEDILKPNQTSQVFLVIKYAFIRQEV